MLIVEKLSQQEKMTEIERTIAAYFINIGRELNQKSSRIIASELYVSPSTISRFCQSLGYQGYNDFKIAYLEEVSYLESNFHQVDPNLPFSKKDRHLQVASKLAVLYKETIEDSLSLLHHDSLQGATRRLLEAKTIYMAVAGDAFEMAGTFKNRMLKIGKSVVVEQRNDNLYFIANQVDRDACFILMSYSGETKTLLKVADRLKSRGIPTIIITSFGDNSLSKMFDLVLHISTREKLVENLGNFSSLLSFSFLLDTLYANVFAERFDTSLTYKIGLAHEYEQQRRSSNPIINDQK